MVSKFMRNSILSLEIHQKPSLKTCKYLFAKILVNSYCFRFSKMCLKIHQLRMSFRSKVRLAFDEFWNRQDLRLYFDQIKPIICIKITSTWTPSISQRSPTSKGWMMNKKMISSKMVLHVFPKTKATTRSWELATRSNLGEAISRTWREMTTIIVATITFTILWSLFTAVFVSFNVNARALLSLKAFTCMQQNNQIKPTCSYIINYVI